jgi:serine/threonine protein kinase
VRVSASGVKTVQFINVLRGMVMLYFLGAAMSSATMQVAQGMAALESLDPPIVHRDLKPSNIFIDGGGCARVADMNLSLRLHPDSLVNLTGETGTYMYMSPEMMRHEVRLQKLSLHTRSL